MSEYVDTNKDGCPECGGRKVDGLGCWEQLGMLISWEWEDAGLAREHFLTVASYNMQHPAQFTEEAIKGLRVAMVDYLDGGATVQELRRRNSQTYEGNKRVLRPEAEQRPVLRCWEMTIADVYAPEEKHGAADRVRAWGRSILEETVDTGR